MRAFRFLSTLVLVALLLPWRASVMESRANDGSASPLPSANPEEVGLASDRLDRLNQELRRIVDAGQCSGFVTLVARHGRVADWRAYGYRDIEAKLPMEKDTIFRIYSNSKLITSVA